MGCAKLKRQGEAISMSTHNVYFYKLVEVIQMSTHNVFFYKENQNMYHINISK